MTATLPEVRPQRIRKTVAQRPYRMSAAQRLYRRCP
jgi:hypothetical protein